MNRFFTLLLAASCMTAVGQVDFAPPYNPDSDGNSFIQVNDLSAFLTLYGLSFDASELSVNHLICNQSHNFSEESFAEPLIIPENSDVIYLMRPEGYDSDGEGRYALQLPSDTTFKTLMLIVGPLPEAIGPDWSASFWHVDGVTIDEGDPYNGAPIVVLEQDFSMNADGNSLAFLLRDHFGNWHCLSQF